MRTLNKLGTAIALAIGFAYAVPMVVHAETETTVTTTTTKHHYMYYPEHEIYFAPDTKTYYWRTGDKWESGVTLPEADRTYVTSGGVQIDLDVDRPYEKHEWVLKHYKDRHDRD